MPSSRGKPCCRVPSDPDDFTTMAAPAWALPLRLGHRHRIGAAAAARDQRSLAWPHRQSDADALHNAGGLSLSGSTPPEASHAVKRAKQPRKTSMRTCLVRMATPCAGLVLLAGCAVGPPYQRPIVATPENFKETEGWKFAQPTDEAILRGRGGSCSKIRSSTRSRTRSTCRTRPSPRPPRASWQRARLSNRRDRSTSRR